MRQLEWSGPRKPQAGVGSPDPTPERSAEPRWTGSKMKTPTAMSGSMWLSLMKPVTFRPVSPSISRLQVSCMTFCQSRRSLSTASLSPASTRLRSPFGESVLEHHEDGVAPEGRLGLRRAPAGGAGQYAHDGIGDRERQLALSVDRLVGHRLSPNMRLRRPALRRDFASRQRRRPESNRCRRLCRPLRSHSATSPSCASSVPGRRPMRG
jgi:hypothetical protein